jgi:hypothetical protein
MKTAKALAACIFWLANQINAEAPQIAPAVDGPDFADSLTSLTAEAGMALDSSADFRLRDSTSQPANPWDKLGFSGFMENRFNNHQYQDHPAWMAPDAAGSNLDGRLGLTVSLAPNAYMKATSTVTFASGFSGAFLNDRASIHPRRVDIPGIGEAPDTVRADESRFPSAQAYDREGVSVFKDIAGQVDFQSPYANGNVRAGTVLWLEGSPLTLWNRAARPKSVWYREDFDPEASTALSYERNSFSRESDLQRLSSPKKPFGGAELNVFHIPYGFDLHLAYTDAAGLAPTRIENPWDVRDGETPSMASSADLGAMYYGRIAQTGALEGITLGVNMVRIDLSEDLINQRIFSASPVQGYMFQFKGGKQPYFVNPQVFSVDGRGQLSPDFSFQAELGLSLDDSVSYKAVAGQPGVYDGRSRTGHKAGAPQPAAYAKLDGIALVPFTAEVFFASKGFWSPYGMTEAGASLRRDEMRLGAGSAGYQSNLAGVNLRIAPKLDNGFIIVGIGQHVQIAKSRDVMQFQHVLNGRDVWSSSTSGARASPEQMLDDVLPPGNPKYENRLGDLGPSRDLLYGGQERGGLRGENRELWEEFAAYATKAQADSGLVPSHRKFATTLSLDWGIRMDPWFEGWLPSMLNLYGETDAIGTDLGALGNTGTTLLWSGLARCEPAVSLTSRLVILGQLGVETWKSKFAWKNSLYNQAATGQFNNVNYYEPLSSLSPASQNAVPRVDAVAAPIDYLQLSYGAGCDWDFSAHAALNLRFKYATHKDGEIPSNAWSGIFLSAGTQIWF